MAKIRHIAFRSEDVEATVALFHEVMDMEIVQRRKNGGVDLSDGDVNITVLPVKVGVAPGAEARPGLDHIGFTVEDQQETHRRFLAHGAKELPPIALGDAYFESKYLAPQGFTVDVGHWAGTSPIGASALAGSAAESD